MTYKTSSTAKQKASNHNSKYIPQIAIIKELVSGLIKVVRQRHQQHTWCVTEQSHCFISSISVYHIMVEKCDIAPLAVIGWCKSSHIWVKEI